MKVEKNFPPKFKEAVYYLKNTTDTNLKPPKINSS